MGALQLVTALLRQLFQSRAALAAENLALRHQIVILQRSVKRPRLHRRDRIFWVWLSHLWPGWRSSLIVVQPETVIRWHRLGFRLYWRWKSRSRRGRPKLDAEIRALIRRMSRENLCLPKTRYPWNCGHLSRRSPSCGVPPSGRRHALEGLCQGR